MALIKPIILDNGVTVNYHRVVSVTNITNSETIIEVASYTSKEKREEEKAAQKKDNRMNIFINTVRIPIPYEQDFSAYMAYEYLKSENEAFKNAKDD